MNQKELTRNTGPDQINIGLYSLYVEFDLSWICNSGNLQTGIGQSVRDLSEKFCEKHWRFVES